MPERPGPPKPPTPDAHEKILGDLTPVRPLRPPWLRALVVFGAYTVAGVLLVGAGMGWRPDLQQVGPIFSWGVSALFLVAAYLVTVGVLRESIPGARLPASAWIAVWVVVIASQYFVASLLHARSPFPVPETDGVTVKLTAACAGVTSGLGLPVVLLLLLLVRQAMPARFRTLGFMAGLAGTVGAEALWRLHCPYTSPAHLLTAHFPAYLVLGLVGAGVVVAAQAWRGQRART